MSQTLPIRARSSVLQPDALSARIHELLDKWHLPGLSIALVNDQEIISKGYGKATLDPPKPCTAETLYDIASCSKSLTAAAIALLVDDDSKFPEIQWHSKMCDLLPEDFVMSEESYTKDITVEDVLSHRTGLPSHDLSYLGLLAKVPDTPKSITRNLRNLPVTEPVRGKFQYCNLMYAVVTHLIETVTGVSFEEFLHTQFFSPLGMNSSNLQPPAAIAAGLEERIATPYRWIEESGSYRKISLQHMPQSQGAGQIVTSVVDWAKYIKAMIHREGPINQAVYAGITKPRILISSDEGGEGDADNDDDAMPFTSLEFYAAGWEIRWYRGWKIVQHDGGVPGFGSVSFFIPGKKFGGVIAGNGGDAAGTVSGILSKELIDEILGVPKDERSDWEAWHVNEQREYEESKGSMSKTLCPDLEECQPLEKDLKDYVGIYWNVGYHEMVVEIRDGKLFINASDRSEGFFLTLEHVCDQTTFIGHMVDYFDGMEDELAVQFKFEESKVVSLGVKDEDTYDEYVWYERKEKM